MSLQGAIELVDGKPSYTLDSKEWRGDGTERIGYGSGPKPFVLFYARAMPHGAESLAAGRPVFKTIVYMKLQHPGERDFIDRPATRLDANNYAVEYRHYCSGREDRPDGAPLELLFPNHPDVVTVLQFHRIYNVEQLAALNDTQMQNLGFGGFEWMQKARRWLDAMKQGDQGFAALEEGQRKLQIENGRLAEQNKQLISQVQALTSQISNLTNSLAQMGGVIPGMVTHGMAPGASAMPIAQPSYLQSNGFASPAAGEIGADEHKPTPRPTDAAAQLMPVEDLMRGDTFAEDLAPVPAAIDQQSETTERRGPGRPRRN
jgi:hypothetical protein